MRGSACSNMCFLCTPFLSAEGHRGPTPALITAEKPRTGQFRTVNCPEVVSYLPLSDSGLAPRYGDPIWTSNRSAPEEERRAQSKVLLIAKGTQLCSRLLMGMDYRSVIIRVFIWYLATLLFKVRNTCMDQRGSLCALVVLPYPTFTHHSLSRSFLPLYSISWRKPM